MHIADFRTWQFALSLLNRAQNLRHALIAAVTDVVPLFDVLSPLVLRADCRLEWVSVDRGKAVGRARPADKKLGGFDTSGNAGAGACCN